MPVSPVSKYLIPDLPSVDDVLPYLRRIDAARWYSNFGPLVCEFEDRLRSLLTADDVLPLAGRICLTTLVSGHHALEVGLRLSGVGPDNKVLVPAITFASCPLAVQHAGAEAVLVDVDPVSWTLTPQIARAVSEHTKIDAVMPVAVYGVPLPASEWDEFHLESGIPVVIDAAAAIDTQVLPRRGLVAHSLHATKPFGIGEGGVLLGRNPDLIAAARRYSNFGMTNRVSYVDGSNAKLSEYHAAVGLAQLDRWDDIKARRSYLLQLYTRHIEPFAALASFHPSIEAAVVSCLMLLLKDPLAEAVLEQGQQTGIGFHRTYLPPLYRHPYFANLRVIDCYGNALHPDANAAQKRAHMPNSERLMECLVGLPFHPFMNEEDVVVVVGNLTAAVGRLARD